jgi:adenylate cyclase class IV
MGIEYEAKYLNVDKDEVRARLKNAGALLVLPEFKQRRWVLDLPHRSGYDEWLRVRDEGNKITLSYKSNSGDALGDQ